MRLRIIIIGTVLIFQFCTGTEKKSDNSADSNVKTGSYEMGEFLITRKSIGYAYLGQTISDFKQKYKNQELTTVPVWNFCVDGGGDGILLTSGKELLLFVWTMQGNDSIHSITGISKRFRTPEGLGPSITAGQLLKHFPDLMLRNDGLCEGLESFRDRQSRITFEFISNDSTRVGVYADYDSPSMPVDTSRLVMRIRISK